MRTSYLRPCSRCWRRYHDSRPRGVDAEGNRTGSRVGRIVGVGVRVCRRSPSRLGRALGRTTGRGPRKMVFSTLAFTVQACVTTRSSPARTRIFGVQTGRMDEVKERACSHVGQRTPIGQLQGLVLLRAARSFFARPWCLFAEWGRARQPHWTWYSSRGHGRRAKSDCPVARFLTTTTLDSPPHTRLAAQHPATREPPFRYPIHTPPIHTHTMREVISLNGTHCPPDTRPTASAIMG